MNEQKNTFLEFLNYQICIKNRFYNKIPDFKNQLNECNKQLEALRIKFENIYRRDIYKTIIREYKELIKNKR
ncbi:MAG: hypothetical protein ACTSVV_17755 [Promethearchaeota archaeon]